MKKKKVRVDDKDPGTAGEIRRQYGAVPYRIGEGGHLEVMLVTSRETRRWVVPKGWPIKDLKPHSSAEREAYEEAGIIGRIAKRPCGAFRYVKRLNSGEMVSCEVQVYPFEVRRELSEWPEKGQRQRMWTAPASAAELVQEPDLAELLRTIALEPVK